MAGVKSNPRPREPNDSVLTPRDFKTDPIFRALIWLGRNEARILGLPAGVK